MVCHLVRLLGKIPKVDTSLTVKEIAILFSEQNEHMCHVPIIMKILESNPEYANVRLKDYINKLDDYIPHYFRNDKD